MHSMQSYGADIVHNTSVLGLGNVLRNKVLGVCVPRSFMLALERKPSAESEHHVLIELL